MPTLELISEIQSLKAQLTQCQERLAVAERLFTELERLTELMSGPGMSWDRNDLSKLHTWIEVFLTYAPSDWVAVWRDDLEKAVDFMEHTAGSYWSEVKERLKT